MLDNKTTIVVRGPLIISQILKVYKGKDEGEIGCCCQDILKHFRFVMCDDAEGHGTGGRVRE